jgi:hypothetical protein
MPTLWIEIRSIKSFDDYLIFCKCCACFLKEFRNLIEKLDCFQKRVISGLYSQREKHDINVYAFLYRLYLVRYKNVKKNDETD